jgi:hypothetical protein
MPRLTLAVLALLGLLCGFSACAKYPVVVNASASAPAPTHAPTR